MKRPATLRIDYPSITVSEWLEDVRLEVFDHNPARRVATIRTHPDTAAILVASLQVAIAQAQAKADARTQRATKKDTRPNAPEAP